MRHYAARQRESNKRWHYTCAHDGSVYAVGPCAEGCPGHETAAEACEHYRQDLLRRARFDSGDPETARTMHRCDVPDCNTFTVGTASIPDQMFHYFLCDTHRNPESLAPLIQVGERWSS